MISTILTNTTAKPISISDLHNNHLGNSRSTPKTKSSGTLLAVHPNNKEDEQQVITPKKEIQKASSFVRRLSSRTLKQQQQRSSSRILHKQQQQQQQQQQQSRDKITSRNYIICVLCLVACTLFRLYAQWASRGVEGLTGLVSNSINVLCCCFVLQNVVYAIFPHCKKQPFLAHYVTGCLHHLCFMFSYLLSEELFSSSWNSVFCGYYTFTIILMITHPEAFSQTFIVYYTVHHCLSYLISGSWALISCCKWETYLHRGLSLWLSAALWECMLYVYTTLNKPTAAGSTSTTCSGISKGLFRKLKTITFGLVQTQKMTAYVQTLVAAGFKPSKLDVAVLGAGFIMDVGNAAFILRSILKSYAEQKENAKVDTKSLKTVH